jgi:hypothetical protein
VVMPCIDALTTWDIDFGRQLWQALRNNSAFPATGLLWLLESESGWRLLIATDRVDQVGRRKAYEELANATRGVEPGTSQPSKIELVSPQAPLYQALRALFKDPHSAEGARLSNTQVGGIYVEDAYMYGIT